MTDFPVVNFPYLNSNIAESLNMAFLFHSLFFILRFIQNMKIFCSENLFWFQCYWWRNIQGMHLGNSMVVIQMLYTNTCMILLCHICLRVCSPTVTCCVHLDGCHTWGRKCSIFPEYLISHPLGSSWYPPFIIYIHYDICQSMYYIYGFMTPGCAWISLTALSRTCCI